MILGVEDRGDSELLEIAETLGLQRFAFRLADGRGQKASENGDDSDHHEEFDQSEGFRLRQDSKAVRV